MGRITHTSVKGSAKSRQPCQQEGHAAFMWQAGDGSDTLIRDHEKPQCAHSRRRRTSKSTQSNCKIIKNQSCTKTVHHPDVVPKVKGPTFRICNEMEIIKEKHDGRKRNNTFYWPGLQFVSPVTSCMYSKHLPESNRRSRCPCCSRTSCGNRPSGTSRGANPFRTFRTKSTNGGGE